LERREEKKAANEEVKAENNHSPLNVPISESKSAGIFNTSPNTTPKKQVNAVIPDSKDSETTMNFCYTKFILENRLPFSIIRALIDFTAYININFTPSDIAQFKSSRQTVTRVAKAIGDTLREELYSSLESSPFSLSVDKSSDQFGKIYLVVCAKFLPEHLTTKLITTLPVTKSSTGQVLFNDNVNKVLINRR